MVEEQGVVKEVAGDWAWVLLARRSTCESCGVKKGCGTSLLSRLMSSRVLTVKLKNTLNAEIGDEVILGLDEDVLLSGSLWVYMLPLITMFALAVTVDVLLEQMLPLGEGITIAAAVIGLLIGFLFVRLRMSSTTYAQRLHPKMLRKRQMTMQHVIVGKF